MVWDNKSKILFWGTNLTKPLRDKLLQTHKDIFGAASKKITKHQRRYKKDYDRKKKTSPFSLSAGDKVQYRKHHNKKAKNKSRISWLPRGGYCFIHRVNKKKKTITFRDINGEVLKKKKPFDWVRKFKGHI